MSAVAGLGCALVAGVLFAFSSFVMPALARMAPPHGIAAMQSINTSILTSSFMAVFLATTIACGIVGVMAVIGAATPRHLAAAVIFLVGTLATTLAFNVPRNTALAALDPASHEAAAQWPRYLAGWTGWNHVRTGAAALAATMLAAGCTPAFRDCAPIPATQLAALPALLSQTGLYAEGVRPFTPRFTSWTDDATKRRWIYLPPGTQIDTSDPDSWNFPAGTKLWKELTRDGIRIETRLLFKHGSGITDWTPVAYVWDKSGDARATPDGLANARGTAHDVPSAGTCVGCHGGSRSGVLGFTAIQLPAHAAPGEIGLDTLADRVTRPLPANALPGTATTQAALGYLHANCSHCHNQDRPLRAGPRCFDPERSFSFLLRTDALARAEDTATYRTAIGRVISAGHPDESEVIDRIHSRDPRFGMPALGTEEVDDQGARLLATWIGELEH